MKVKTSHWKLVVHECARDEVNYFGTNHKELFAKIRCALMELIAMEDPREHRLVASVKYEAPGWYRLVVDYVRVIFRLLEDEDGRLVEVWSYQDVDKDEAEHTLEVMRVAQRCRVYDDGRLHSRRLRY